MVTQAEADGNPPRHVQGVSQRLAEAFGLALAPGQSKGECPFCHHKTFSIRRDDSIGKCFHSACLKWLGPATQADVTAGPTLASVLDMIFHDWHQVLLDLAKHPYPKDAYRWRVLANEAGSIDFDEPVLVDHIVRPEGRDQAVSIGRFLQGPRKLKHETVLLLRDAAGEKWTSTG